MRTTRGVGPFGRRRRASGTPSAQVLPGPRPESLPGPVPGSLPDSLSGAVPEGEGDRTTTVHDGQRLASVTAWLGAPSAVHLGDDVGSPRGGLAPDGTYHIRLPGTGHLIVVSGRLEAWPDQDWSPEQWPGGRSGFGPCLTPHGELDPAEALDHTPSPLRLVGSGGPTRRDPTLSRKQTPAAPARSGRSWTDCPRCATARVHVAGPEDETRERAHRHMQQVVDLAAETVAAQYAHASATGAAPDPEEAGACLARALYDLCGLRPVARDLAARLDPAVLRSVLVELARLELSSAPLLGQVSVAVPVEEPAGSPARMLAEEAIARHGAAVLSAVPAHLLAEGIAAEALLVPELERLVGHPLPGPLAPLAVQTLNGLQAPLAAIDPTEVTGPLHAVTGLPLR